jgi:hydroxyethylthiazole kinase-like uncharacterized protein yjeF
MEILLFSWIKKLDRQAIHTAGIPSLVLMENAARESATYFAAEFPLAVYKKCLLLIGKGNNGGDGLAIGRLLLERGYGVHFLLLAPPDQLSTDARTNYDLIRALDCDIEIVANTAKLKKILAACDAEETFLVDAVFGTGLDKPVNVGLFAESFAAVNRSGIPVAAVDIPSGLGEDFPAEAGIHIRARVTAALHCLKWAHLNPDGNPDCGRICVLDIGIPNDLGNNEEHYIRLIEPADFKVLLAKRNEAAHKGDFGHVLVVAGSGEKPGAGILASYAVLKAGAGLCTAAVPTCNRDLYVLAHPEIMTLIYESPEELAGKLNDFSCVLAGPGLGNHPSTAQTVDLLLSQSRVPVILDADALNVLQGRTKILQAERSWPIVLTPHAGEFARLLGKSTRTVVENRLALSREFAMKYRLYLILKGHHTLVVTPQGFVFVNQTGNAGMATAGSGDVLGGMIAGLLAQFFPKYPLEMILPAAVFLHGYAGDLAVRQTGEMGLTASDIVAFIPQSILKINGFHSPFLGS